MSVIDRPSETAVIGHFIDGKPCVDAAARTGAVYDPATGTVTKRVTLGDAAAVGAAVTAAQAALPGWKATTPLRRARVMFKFKELLAARRGVPRPLRDTHPLT